MRSILGLLLAAICLLSTSQAEAQGVLSRAAERGTLIAAVVPDSLPQAARDDSGELIGFDVEVAAEIAKQVRSVDIFCIASLITVWTAIFTVAIGCIVVFIMKGPAYAADSYDVSHSDRPRRRDE